MLKKQQLSGHLLAVICILVWGTTFLVSKSLTDVVKPAHLMLMRFALAYMVLWIMHPKWAFQWKLEVRFLLMAVFSNTLYSWSEITALSMTQASNVSILVSTSPIFTALFLAVFHRDERLRPRQILGIAISFLGVILVVYNGAASLKINPLGDLLALIASISWALYGILLKRWSGEHSSLLITRKLMFYGILTTLPLVLFSGQPVHLKAVLNLPQGIKLLYLAVMGSALCYFFWNSAVKTIGVLKTNLYVYAIPLVTFISGAALGQETITIIGLLGIIVVITGMVLTTLSEIFNR